MNLTIAEIDDCSLKSEYCREIIPLLPDWFGMAEANENYISGMAGRVVFAAFQGEGLVGIVGLKDHMARSLEVWWMGVKPDCHGQGVGTDLFETARSYAVAHDYEYMIVNTLSDRSDDEYYARTRAFYQKMGFDSLFEENENDPLNPMVWMILPLSGGREND